MSLKENSRPFDKDSRNSSFATEAETSELRSFMLRSTTTLTLAAADAIANASIEAVNHLVKFAPVTVTVLDNAGGILVQKRMDGCPAGAYAKFSYAKARTCIHLGTSSRTFRSKYTAGGDPPKMTQASSMVSVMNGDLIPVAGGVLIKNALDGSVVGAVGVSGAAADEDEYIALEGVRVGTSKMDMDIDLLETVPAAHCCTTLSGID